MSSPLPSYDIVLRFVEDVRYAMLTPSENVVLASIFRVAIAVVFLREIIFDFRSVFCQRSIFWLLLTTEDGSTLGHTEKNGQGC